MDDWRIESWFIKPEKLFNLTEKVIIVTGGASGLGRAIALGTAAFGAKVVIADINQEGAKQVAGEIDGEKLVLRVDVTKLRDIRRMVEETRRRFGRIDVSFNIPGINVRKPALELSKRVWDEVVSFNLNTIFYCAREVGKVMLRQKKGSMINMASARALVGGIAQSPYSASKGGISQLTKCLAAEWAPHVRVNALAPGYIETQLVREMMKNDDWYTSMKQKHLLSRFGRPEEVVGAAIFLASDASSFVTGSVLCVDGGWTAI
ncbi:MAG: glucose 1-dehydrogenase [Nitrososphaeria archaeon]|nr:glucose 1-dehydrogenase [Nitrososphaeria archaeon]NIN53092.1 glucose 1-dehydrogenase [Nitrososphaeria archaeon]NIQ33858.1 glucose 1-dehydrogenase [Nitrososphaeria archaeon]